MKKILGVLLIAATMISSTFALGLSIGGKGSLGGSFDKIQNEALKNNDVSKLNYGGGAYVNAELLFGLGAQAEANYVHNNVTGLNYLDVPVMGWWELNFFDAVSLGVGCGVNFNKVLSKNDNFKTVVGDAANIGDWNKDIAVGANLKIFFTRKHIGLVIGANGVFDMGQASLGDDFKAFFVDDLFHGNFKDIADTKSGTLRKDMYATLGLEFRFF